MSTPQKSFSVKLDQPLKEELDSLMSGYLDQHPDLTKAQAVYNILKQGTTEARTTDYIEADPESKSIQYVLDEIRNRGCHYLIHDDSFLCLEKMDTSKKPANLGFNPDLVYSMCLACLNRQVQKAQQKAQDILNKAGAKQLQDFIKKMVQLKDSNFKVDIFLCMAESDKNKIQASSDGQSLNCPLMNNETIYIKTHCQQRINPDTRQPPCQFLVSYEQYTKIDDTVFKQFQITEPQLENLQTINLEPIERPNTVEAEYTIVESPEEKEK